MTSVSSQEKSWLKDLSFENLHRGGKKGILFGDDVIRVPNPMFLSSDARAHRSRTDLPICVSENIVKCKGHFLIAV